VGFPDEDFKECYANWVLANMEILMEDHGLHLGFWHDGCGKACVQHEIVLCCMSLGIVVDGSMSPDLVQGDLSVMHNDGVAWSRRDGSIFWYGQNVSPSTCHCSVSKHGQEELEPVGLERE